MKEIVIDIYDINKGKTISYILAPLNDKNDFVKLAYKNDQLGFNVCIDTGHDLIFTHFNIMRYIIVGMHTIE